MNASPLVSLLARVALFGAGGLVSIFGVVWCVKTALFVSRAKKTEGEIVRFHKVRTTGGWASHPVFAYRDGTGHRWEGTTDYSSASFAIGQKVAVIYDHRRTLQREIGPMARDLARAPRPHRVGRRIFAVHLEEDVGDVPTRRPSARLSIC